MKPCLALILFFCLVASPFGAAQDQEITDPLLRVLAAKGVITAEEAKAVNAAATPAEQRDRLAVLLRDKGLLTDTELASVTQRAAGARSQNGPVLLASASPNGIALPSVIQSPKPATAAAPTPPPIIAAIAPIRLLPIDPVKKEGIIPDIKLGSGARIKPYGFFKSSVIYDTSSPGGNDMPLVGFLGDTGPDTSPEFHIKARAFRVGAQFEWLDMSPKWAITARFEGDFEGNFSRANNRNISSIRSNAFQVRSAWGRVDYNASPKTSWFASFGQDWTPFGSSTIPNIVETTGLGLGYGILYERAPMVRTGIIKTLGGSRNWKFSPEFAIVLPSYGNVPTDVGNQLGYGERQGADSARPEVQGRLVLQWQLDKAAGVAPAQLIASFTQGRREAIVTAAGVPAGFKAAFPNGAQVSSDRYGYSLEGQFPTRDFTFIAKYFNGKDLRFYFVDELFSNFSDTAGLTGTVTAPSIDGSANVIFGLRNGVPSVAPQRGVRTQGWMGNLGFPLSRIFSANPSGRNAGWTAYLHYSYDYSYARDVRRFAGGRTKSDLAAANIQYKLNAYVTFLYEQSQYRTRAANNSSTDIGGLPLLRGIPSRQWHDIRSEFSTLFTF